MVNRPDDSHHSDCNWGEWAPWRAISIGLKKRFDLPFNGPPVVKGQRKIDKNDRVGLTEPFRQSRPIAPTINNPGVTQQKFIVNLIEIIFRQGLPAGLPLDIVNGEVINIQRLTEKSG